MNHVGAVHSLERAEDLVDEILATRTMNQFR